MSETHEEFMARHEANRARRRSFEAMLVEQKAKINEVFRAMRKLGYISRQNYLCCGNCAGTAIANQASEAKDRGKTVRGCVFYHRQNTEHWREDGHLWLHFGSIDSAKHGEIGVPTKQCGEELVAACAAVGLPCNWDGNPDTCVEILPLTPTNALEQVVQAVVGV